MVDASTMLGTFMESFPGLEDFLNLGVALLGVVLTGMAVFKFIEYNRLNGIEGGRSLVTPVMYLLAGTALFNFAASVDTFLETIYGPSTSVHNLLGYSAASAMPQESKLMMKALLGVLRLYGYFTFVRGWLSVRRIGSGQNGSDEIFKAAMIRIFAGVGLINIVESVNIVSSTFGFGSVL